MKCKNCGERIVLESWNEWCHYRLVVGLVRGCMEAVPTKTEGVLYIYDTRENDHRS
jgi:hypothetical protein